MNDRPLTDIIISVRGKWGCLTSSEHSLESQHVMSSRDLENKDVVGTSNGTSPSSTFRASTWDSMDDGAETPTRCFEDSDLHQAVYKYVQQYMSRFDMSHDFNHILRVQNLAKHILAEELKTSPWKKLHKQAVVLAALLHDVGDSKYAQPGENAEHVIEDLLQKNGCPPRFVAKVALICQHVSYSSEVKRPQLVKVILGAHPELAIVQDADRIDAIGAIGIARTFAYGALKASDRGLQGCIDHFTDKLENIEGMMKTETGRRMARERTQRLKDFRKWWEEENSLIP